MYGDTGPINRSVDILVAGCERRVLGGSGNGDLMMTRDGGMLAPPLQIEAVLGQAGEILKKEIMDLRHFELDDGEKNSLAQKVRPSIDGER